MPSFLVSSLTPFSDPAPVAVCPSLAEADALIDKLAAAVPKGDLTMFSRVPVEGEAKPGFRVAKVAAALASFAESF